MNESSKTKKIRESGFEEKYLSGKVIDIGCGPDKVVEHAVGFDKEDGNANKILDHFEPASFDTVHSSHALEHIHDPVNTLSDWWELVKPGGYIVTIVPEEDLYEHGFWPSKFNGDHKSTFTLNRKSDWSSVSYDILELHKNLPNAKIISAEVQDNGYDYSLPKEIDQTMGDALAQIQVVAKKMKRRKTTK
jgi:SAM-dependent methyltransferase